MEGLLEFGTIKPNKMKRAHFWFKINLNHVAWVVFKRKRIIREYSLFLPSSFFPFISLSVCVVWISLVKLMV